MENLLTRQQRRDILHISRQHEWRLEKAGRMPKPDLTRPGTNHGLCFKLVTCLYIQKRQALIDAGLSVKKAELAATEEAEALGSKLKESLYAQ